MESKLLTNRQTSWKEKIDMLRILLTVVATLCVVFAAYCIEGYWLQQVLLFWSGFMFASLLMMSNEKEV